jgi:3'(2'), 5'-bisphosphate nucleotidase
MNAISGNSDLDAALQSARLAGREIMRLYASFEAMAHAPVDISTEADKRSQETILDALAARYPNDAFCAEENTAGLHSLARSGGRLWVIDPIDGSRGFAMKNGQFSVMIGLVLEGRIELGVVFEPVLDRCTWAVRGQGCWSASGEASPKRHQTSSTVRLEECSLVRSHSERGAIPCSRQIGTYSAGIKLAMVARAEADLYVSTYNKFHSWDLCAGHILVEEAGGSVSNRHGQPIAYKEDGGGLVDGTVASNGPLHAAALQALHTARGGL